MNPYRVSASDGENRTMDFTIGKWKYELVETT